MSPAGYQRGSTGARSETGQGEGVDLPGTLVTGRFGSGFFELQKDVPFFAIKKVCLNHERGSTWRNYSV